MKKLLMSAALIIVASVSTAPALAGHRGFYRGQCVIGPRRLFVAPVRPRLSFSVGFGAPGFFYGAGYRPSPVYYGPPPMMVAPLYGPGVWVPGRCFRRRA